MTELYIKFLKDFNQNDLNFKPVRTTTSGSSIIDVDGNILFQTGWLKILYDVDYTICVDSEKIKEILNRIDEIVIDHSSKSLKISKEQILNMYRPLLEQYINTYTFRIPILSDTILFDNNRNFYDKSEIKNILKQGQNIRFIFGFKKIYLKNNKLTFPLDLKQIELA